VLGRKPLKTEHQQLYCIPQSGRESIMLATSLSQKKVRETREMLQFTGNVMDRVDKAAGRTMHF
jgi:hypothetical protein